MIYRTYIKDQMNLTAKPKAHLEVRSFDVKNDLLASANSTIDLKETPENISTGDVLVLYSSKGKTLYQGVVTKVSDKQISCSQMQSFYKGAWVYNTDPQTYLEAEIKSLIQDYADGKIKNSTYVDNLVAQRLGGITVSSVNSIAGCLPDDEKTMDFESFLYDLYKNYDIIPDFAVNFSGTNTLTIKKSDYTAIKIGNNNNSIVNLSPIRTVEETNRLIVFDSEGNYRSTFVATSNGIVEEPSSLDGRFYTVNTNIVYSDDDLATLVQSNLPEKMFNHKITFDLKLNGGIYKWDDFKLGMPLSIWKDGDYFDSVLTGWQMSVEENKELNLVSLTCGKCRTSLTSKLAMARAFI